VSGTDCNHLYVWGINALPIALIAAALLTALAVPLAMLSAEAATHPLQFGKIYYDSPGSDTGSNASLNAEYVTIKNSSSKARSLTGYTVRDKANHLYPLFDLAKVAFDKFSCH
jgi:hypothetical protein